jgi:hypothetical protein
MTLDNPPLDMDNPPLDNPKLYATLHKSFQLNTIEQPHPCQNLTDLIQYVIKLNTTGPHVT